LPTPVYHHHDLVLDEAGHKLSKSRGAQSLRSLRQDGLSPADVYNRLGLTLSVL
jgi:glutamyl-Q tRNA(Asp) synthetase